MSSDKASIKVQGGIVYFYATDTSLTTATVKEIAGELETVLSDNTARVLVVNQLKCHQELSTAEDKAWIDLYRSLPEKLTKTVTICQTLVNKLQTNYVFKMEGVSDRFKAFVPEDTVEMCQFLGVDAIAMD